MKPGDLTAHRFCFGAFEVSKEEGALRKNGKAIPLPPQSFQILLLLLERAGEVVTREELQRLTWPDNTVVDFELGINRCIRRIRSALLDDADAPRYIETIPRIGYRFIAPLSVVAPELLTEPTPTADTAEELPVEPSPGSSRSFKWPSITMAAVVCCAVFAIVFTPPRKSSHLSSDLNTVPLAVSLGDQFTPSFSPDGGQIAFAWNGETQDNFDIYLKTVGSSTHVLRLTTNADIDYSPAWSPDGQWIAFCRGTDARGGAVWLIPALGGPERKLIDLDDVASPQNRTISWLKNSKALVVAAALSGQKERGLHVVSIDTGGSTALTTPSHSEEDMHPVVSGDGRTVAFTRDTGRGISSILLTALAGERTLEAVPMPQQKNTYNAHPAWTPDGSHIAFVSNTHGETRLWLSDVRGLSPAVEVDALGTGVHDAVISDSGQLSLVRQVESSNIWALDLGQVGGGTPKLTRLFASTRTEETPAVRPDGKQIAFVSNRSGYSEIWTGRADGSDAMQVTFLHNPVTGSPDWSPDGRRLVFDSRDGDHAQLFTLSADGGRTEALPAGHGLSVVPRWSPDGKWIYFSSDRSGRMEVWRMPSHGGPAEQVTHDGGFAAVLSRDGSNVYYSSDNSPVTSLWRLQLATGKRTLVATSVIRRAYVPIANGAYLFSGTSSKRQSALWSYDERTEHSTELLTTDKKIANGIAISPDEQTLYYSQWEESGHELLLVPQFWK